MRTWALWAGLIPLAVACGGRAFNNGDKDAGGDAPNAEDSPSPRDAPPPPLDAPSPPPPADAPGPWSPICPESTPAMGSGCSLPDGTDWRVRLQRAHLLRGEVGGRPRQRVLPDGAEPER